MAQSTAPTTSRLRGTHIPGTVKSAYVAFLDITDQIGDLTFSHQHAHELEALLKTLPDIYFRVAATRAKGPTPSFETTDLSKWVHHGPGK